MMPFTRLDEERLPPLEAMRREARAELAFLSAPLAIAAIVIASAAVCLAVWADDVRGEATEATIDFMLPLTVVVTAMLAVGTLPSFFVGRHRVVRLVARAIVVAITIIASWLLYATEVNEAIAVVALLCAPVLYSVVLARLLPDYALARFSDEGVPLMALYDVRGPRPFVWLAWTMTRAVVAPRHPTR
jgi:hypothetical protein